MARETFCVNGETIPPTLGVKRPRISTKPELTDLIPPSEAAQYRQAGMVTVLDYPNTSAIRVEGIGFSRSFEMKNLNLGDYTSNNFHTLTQVALEQLDTYIVNGTANYYGEQRTITGDLYVRKE